MSSSFEVVGLCPLERPDVGLVLALRRAGFRAFLDLGREEGPRAAALARLADAGVGLGVRLPDGIEFDPTDLPGAVDQVLLPAGAPLAPWRPRTVWVEVTSLEEARVAVAGGADGLVAKGSESGGRVGDETTFVLLQRLAAELTLPIYARGGIGLHTAAAVAAGGAAGVILDNQLALVRELTLPAGLAEALSSMDGSETAVTGGRRLLSRHGAPAVPVGQDAAFARPLAERFHTAGGVCGAVARAVGEHLQQAQEHRPLAAGSPLARALGTVYPIAQGPMTRVSDRAAFADAVSRAGGLPFLALSLMRGDQARSLLAETAALLGDRPWGAGILGFVPPAIRDAQLAALREVPPPVALIAGGRPSQARPLEEQGTATFLHVPSPGLLDLFLDEGARRFVFEGRECGGHVGPRSSFALWETQIDRLLRVRDPESLHILFAGGIHDARSAAMVAAMAAPLAARGARVGVLMGTAYLLTEEAVATGAILPGFQQAAARCERTVLLETSPGHATRCVDSDYVRAFLAEKQRLTDAGLAQKQIWAELEQLNLGRLRIAAKGLVRDGEQLVPVDEAAQASQGMYMIGQVAALRSETLTMADLHRDVADGATDRLAAIELPDDESERPQVDVAIVGMACVFPGAPDVDSYWSNILAARDAISEVPRSRWNPDLYYDPEATGAGAGKKTPSKWGGFLPPTLVDPLAHGIPPRSFSSIEPVQLLSLEVARRALADAGYADREFPRERASVIFGAEAGTDLSGAYGFRAMFPQVAGELPESLDDALPTLSEDSFPGVLANVIAGRIANRLDLGGVNYTVDAACASSLAAIDLAIKELSARTSDMVLCGGADLHNSINDYLLFSSVHALSPTGRCRPFAANADGISLGEGVACLVLKRLDDARRDGDRVYAVIDGIAGSSDGRSLGLTAPRKEGQQRALRRAYRRAGVSPAEVGLVEAHGTGTVVGDRTELATLTEVFAEAGARPGSCALGSVKSQIGHTKCAAGMAGIIKAALAVERGVRPPTLHVEAPNPAYVADQSPFTLSGSARPWPAERRRAAVSAFGFGGTNFHALLRAPDDAGDQGDALRAWPSELFLFRGRDRAEAIARIDRLMAWVEADAPVALRELALAASRGDAPVQVAVIASSTDELRELLPAARDFRDDDRRIFAAAAEAGQVAFLFPGQGSQRPGMLADLFCAFPHLQQYLRLGEAYLDRLYPPAPRTPAEDKAQRAAVTDTRVAQPTLGIADLAMADLLGRFGVRADMLAGHSYGELVALCAGGAFDARTLIALSEARAEQILAAAGDDPGAMAAVAAPVNAIDAALGDDAGVVVANRNAPKQSVISGPTAAVEAAIDTLAVAGLAAKRIRVACAFHSPVVAAAAESLARALDGAGVAAPSVPVWANATAAPYPADAAETRAILAGQVAMPVRFREQIEAMYAAGARIFVEAGPGRVLTGLVGKILGERPHVAVACDRPGDAGLPSLLRALARLAACGVALDTDALFAGRTSVPATQIDLDATPTALPPSSWWVNGHTATPVKGEAPAGSYRPFTQPVELQMSRSNTSTPAGGAPADSREAAVIEYLRNMREMVSAQRDVMLGLLGQPIPVAATETVAALPAAAAQAVAQDPRILSEVRAEPAPSRRADPAEVLLSIVADRTGYPVEMLDLDLDLEAELSIDSIKRIEILGELRQRLGLTAPAGSSDDEVIEQLAQMKTLRAIISWLADASDEEAATATASEPPAKPEPVAAIPIRRFIISPRQAPPALLNGTNLEGRRFGVTDDGRGLADAVTLRLEEHGAIVRRLGSSDRAGDLDGLVHLAPLAAGADHSSVKRAFSLTREALLGGAQWILATSALGGDFGHSLGGEPLPVGGLAGAIKTVAREWPDAHVRLVNVNPAAPSLDLAEQLRVELLAKGNDVHVGYRAGARYQLEPTAAAPPTGGALGLESDSVVLITGGARGIAARVAVELARRYRCRLELVGRSPLPDPDEPADLAGATDARAVRQALVARGLREPAAIEAECARILAAREVRATLTAIADAGATVCYHAVDVRDESAFGGMIDAIYADHGRIDGAIHAAGVLEDKLVRDKTDESFARVFDTKVAGALTLAKRLHPDVQFVAFFSSIAGAFGNRGQVDYAAANDALDLLARTLNRRIDGRAVAIGWGPWAGTGMVSDELAREYARRGIGLIPPAEGVQRLLDELAAGDEPHVVLMCAEPETLGV